MSAYSITINFEADDADEADEAGYMVRNALQEFGYDPFGKGRVTYFEMQAKPDPQKPTP